MSKIIIHYIWFENYLNFHNQGINLSSKYIFTYNHDDDTIIVKDNSQSYIDNFFGENIVLTAIVGQNGVGKTTFLRFMQSLRHGDLIQIPCLILCERDGEFWAGRYYYDTNTNQIKCKTILIPELPNKELNLQSHEMQRFPFGNDVRFIYITEMFNSWQYASALSGGDDISFASILYNQTEYGEEEKHINNPVVRYIHRITNWQLDFLSNGRKYVEQFNINYPSYVFISPSYDREVFTKLYIRLKSDNDSILESETDNSKLKREARKFLSEFLHNTDNEVLHSIKDEYAIAILMNIISSFNFVLNYSIDQGKKLFDIMNQKIVFESCTSAWSVVYELLSAIKQANEYYDYKLRSRSYKNTDEVFQFSINADAFIKFMDYLSKLLDAPKQYKLNPNYPYTIMKSTLNFESIYEFFNIYKKCIRIVDFISFSWGLSSGENLLLNQYGKLMHLFKVNQNGNYYLPENVNGVIPAQTAVILLDEAEVAFHPEWQRMYLKALLNYLKENVVKSGTHLQLIIATHSPIILSDIPNQNSIFIKKNCDNSVDIVDGEETFAANIYSLFKNSFFLDNSMIGAFAESELKELAKDIHNMNDTSDYSRIKLRINAIGDEFIRKHFLELYHQKKDEATEVEMLQHEVESLKKRIALLENNSTKKGE